MGRHGQKVNCSACNGTGKQTIGENGRTEGPVRRLQRNRESMTDRLDCPNCDGTGEQRLGPLRLLCTFCRGLGYVGDDNEPAERNDDTDEEAHPMEEPPVWQHPATQGLPGCRVCFGSGRVVNLGGDVRGGTPSQMVEAPCPACSG